jgi:hypothetical protein
MVAAAPRAQHEGVPRVLVIWSRPQHLTAEETERWARTELRDVLAADSVRSAELRRLEPASPRYGGDPRWLLELEVAGPARECVENGPCAEWLGDMRLLGMRAEVVVADETVDLWAG